jgi:hypothetical protein
MAITITFIIIITFIATPSQSIPSFVCALHRRLSLETALPKRFDSDDAVPR